MAEFECGDSPLFTLRDHRVFGDLKPCGDILGRCEDHTYNTGSGEGFHWVDVYSGNSTTTKALYYHPTSGSDVAVLTCTTTTCTSPGEGTTSYGTPTVDSGNLSAYGVTLLQPSANWSNTDQVFEVYVAPTKTISASTEFLAIDFGKHWTNGAGTVFYPSCTFSPRLPSAAELVVYEEGAPGAIDGTAAQFSLFTGAGQSLASGTTYVWIVICSGIEQ